MGRRREADIDHSACQSIMSASLFASELFLHLTHRRPRDASPVVLLRADGADPTLFCVTGGGGPAISLRNLSDAMGDRNFAAADTPTLRGEIASFWLKTGGGR